MLLTKSPIAPVTLRRVDAIPVALPLKKPVKMSGVNITHAENLLVRIEATDGTVGWGEAASAPTMTGDTLGGLTAAVRDHLAPLLIGQDAWQRPALMHTLKRALVGNGGARSGRTGVRVFADRTDRQAAADQRAADVVAGKQEHGTNGRRGEGQGG